VISNPNNSTIRQIRKLRKRRERERRHRLIIEGHRALSVALRSKADVWQVLHTAAATTKRAELLRDARARGAAVLEVTPGVMASLTAVEAAPDVLGVASMPVATLADAVRALGFGAVLAGIKDPATAGSILSSCAAAGGTVAIATKGTTDLFAPKPIRAAGGAHYVLTVAPDVAPEECAEALRAAGVRVLAVHPDGRDVSGADVDGPLAVLIAEDGAIPGAFTPAPPDLVGTGAGPGEIRPSVGAEAAVVLFSAARRRRDGQQRPTGK
jgi:RNA methyltransferase, TrmH family